MTPWQKLREAAMAATPGPWRAANGKGSASVVTEHPDYKCAIYLNVRTCEIKDSVDRWQADARFIALANPTAILALLDQLAEMRAARDEACDIADAWTPGSDIGLEDVGDRRRIAALRKVGEP